MAGVSSSRLVGLDLARLVALLGMVAAHLLTGVVDGRVTLTHQVVAGRSSGLFALLAGLAIVLLARTREPVRGLAWRAEQAAALARAVGLGALGLLLGGLVDTGMSVILAYYAVLFALATPFLALRTRWIALAAGVLVLVGPPLSQVLRSVLPRDRPSDPTPASLLDPLDLLQELLLTGSFPVLTWLPFVLAGMVVGRLDLRSVDVTRRLTAVGAGLVLLAWVAADLFLAVPGVREQLERSVARPGGPADLELILSRGFKAVLPTDTWAWLLVRAPHSGAWLDQVNVIGSSCLVIGLCLAVGRRVPERLVVLTGAGSLTLTLYTLHVVSRDRGLVPVDGPDQLLPQVLVMLALGALAHRLGRRGPLEAVLTRMSRAARAAVVVAVPEAEPDVPGVTVRGGRG
ncbi:DUF1624 domain-containing protein [Nocardioides sp. HDW12B]|uniref:heparan-alpha-glucosaminide N-acetyltransferase domain-containing protein n=1 Tax=Nocardioides sp. HDW12B TaxID=2714939 RepID=UPI001408F61F|nr:heparan-alpha-glucosaminide N-acetyltransferase domain-containing protein [Nocardioides sp. HDW12B]QIK65706.1 DUF1624 domain-containing protein [Nocardioides sp. HDW12B]